MGLDFILVSLLLHRSFGAFSIPWTSSTKETSSTLFLIKPLYLINKEKKKEAAFVSVFIYESYKYGSHILFFGIVGVQIIS